VVQRGLDHRDFATTTKGWRILDRNLGRVYTLMLNMLAFSKQREPHLEMRYVGQVIKDVIELTKEQADESGVELIAEYDEEAPPIPLDYDGLHQAVLNLVVNAIEAVPRGSGKVRVAVQFDAVERRVIVRVADNGPGVPKGERPDVFEPFHSNKGQGGTGLGLAVARKNVNELGGSIELCESEEGGAEFVIRLPTAEVRRAAPGETQGATH